MPNKKNDQKNYALKPISMSFNLINNLNFNNKNNLFNGFYTLFTFTNKLYFPK